MNDLNFIVPGGVMEALLAYLQNRPWAEVHGLLTHLSKAQTATIMKEGTHGNTPAE